MVAAETQQEHTTTIVAWATGHEPLAKKLVPTRPFLGKCVPLACTQTLGHTRLRSMLLSQAAQNIGL